ncbi:MAG: hypothetical protein M1150_02825 [Patescibacteria group bacterium]|nr:hypothetical protein [Patescibacteria group bacterium]
MKKLILLIIIFAFFTIFTKEAFAMTAASGDLQVTYDSPLFPPSIIWYPGLSVTKSFTVKNLGSSSQEVFLQGINLSQTGNSASIYDLKVMEGADAKYGVKNEKTLENFWSEGKVSLSTLRGGFSKTFEITTTMADSANNSFQGASLKFDLKVGFTNTNQAVIPTSSSSVVLVGTGGTEATSGAVLGSEDSNQNKGNNPGENSASGSASPSSQPETLGVSTSSTTPEGNTDSGKSNGSPSWLWLVLAAGGGLGIIILKKRLSNN